jgi:hypothetical protein
MREHYTGHPPFIDRAAERVPESCRDEAKRIAEKQPAVRGLSLLLEQNCHREETPPDTMRRARELLAGAFVAAHTSALLYERLGGDLHRDFEEGLG